MFDLPPARLAQFQHRPFKHAVELSVHAMNVQLMVALIRAKSLKKSQYRGFDVTEGPVTTVVETNRCSSEIAREVQLNGSE